MNRIEVRASVLTCTACPLHTKCKAPVPFSGPTPAILSVIGEAPGKKEDELGEPFVGPAGSFLRSLMDDVELDHSQAAFINTVSCFPVDFAGKGRAPAPSEIIACRSNLEAQVALADSMYFLLVGAIPLATMRSGVKISKVRGRPFLIGSSEESIGSKLAMPTFHPSYVLRRGGETSMEADLVREDLRLLRSLIEVGSEEWMSLFPATCLHCDEWAARWDDDGTCYCEEHWPYKKRKT